VNLLSNPAASLLRFALLCAVLAAAAASSAAQTRDEREAAAPSQPSQPSQPRATADEDFELNIDVRRINESDFHAETAVETEGAAGLLLRVGVSLRASNIEVLLRAVRGRVRFRASLAPVLRRLEARRGDAPAAARPTPP
jgi:hypothetical protein